MDATVPVPDRPIRFGLVGGGWRAAFFVRVAQALPQWFDLAPVAVRNPDTAGRLTAEWGVPVHADIAAVVNDPELDFVMLSVPAAVVPELARRIVDAGRPVLTETPVSRSLSGLDDAWQLLGGAPVQVAEQYHLQPMHAARLSLVAGGLLGNPTYAAISVAHEYHQTSLVRRFLGVGLTPATVRAQQFASPAVQGPTRHGPPEREEMVTANQLIGTLDFGDSLGLYDFSSVQYRSWIRTPRLTVRGDRGELTGQHVVRLHDFATPIRGDLVRIDHGHDGDMDGYHLVGIQYEGAWVWQNPFRPARLSDDEIAIAELLRRMGDWTTGGAGAGPYPLAEGLQDSSLALWLAEAARTGETLTVPSPIWGKES